MECCVEQAYLLFLVSARVTLNTIFYITLHGLYLPSMAGGSCHPIFTITYFYKRHVFLLFGCGGRTIDGNLFMVGAVVNFESNNINNFGTINKLQISPKPIDSTPLI